MKSFLSGLVIGIGLFAGFFVTVPGRVPPDTSTNATIEPEWHAPCHAVDAMPQTDCDAGKKFSI